MTKQHTPADTTMPSDAQIAPTKARLISITEQEAADFDLLKTVMHALITKIGLSRGQNTIIKLDSLFSIVPELAQQGVNTKMNDWFARQTALLQKQAEEREAERVRLRADALAKLSPEERAALNV